MMNHHEGHEEHKILGGVVDREKGCRLLCLVWLLDSGFGKATGADMGFMAEETKSGSLAFGRSGFFRYPLQRFVCLLHPRIRLSRAAILLRIGMDVLE